VAKESLLTELHNRNGASFVNHDGWRLPDHFGEPIVEYEAVRNAAGLFDLSQRAMLQFSGPDRGSFLQGMLSNDVRVLKMYEGQQAAILNQQGKVIAEVRVLCAMNSIYLDFWEPLKEKILAHLNRYLVADEVEIHDPNDEWKMLSIQGPRARMILGELFGNTELPSKPDGHGMVQWNGSPMCIVRAVRTSYNGFDLIVPASNLAAFAQRLSELGGSWVGERAQNILRVEFGIARYGVDFTEDNLLLEVGLENAVSFTKGCYLGQEVVERIRSRGHVNKRLCGLSLDGSAPADAGDAIYAGDNDVGKITSSVVSCALRRPIALGYVHRDYWVAGTRLSVRRAEHLTGATVTPLPFVPAPSVTP
jgi:folate-binding protein YgfZ